MLIRGVLGLALLLIYMTGGVLLICMIGWQGYTVLAVVGCCLDIFQSIADKIYGNHCAPWSVEIFIKYAFPYKWGAIW